MSNFHIATVSKMSPLSTVRLNGFLQRIINWCWFYKAQAVIDTVACAVTCMSIITGVILVYHEYCIVTWRKNHFQDLFIDCYTDNPSFDTLLLDDSSNSQEIFVEGRWVRFWWLAGVSTLHAHAQSPKSHNQNVNIKCNAHDVMWLYQSLGGEVLIWPR